MSMVDPSLISIISATTALMASIAGPLVTLYVARMQIRASVRSGNRQRWIDEFRDAISIFCGQIAATTQVREKVFKDGRISISEQHELLREFERLIFTATKIRLMVDPGDGDHARLIASIDELLMMFRTATSDEDVQEVARTSALQIVEMSLGIIRREWLRVQKGA